MIALGQNTTMAMTKMAKWTPEKVEERFEQYRTLQDKIDSVDRSLRFFYEYEGKDKAKFIIQLKGELAYYKGELSNYSEPQTIRNLAVVNEEAVADHIVMMLMELKMFFIVDRCYNEAGAFQIANLIVAEFPQLTLEEICICLNMARKGYFGEDFQRLDGPTIMKWMQRYVKDRQDRLAMKQWDKRVQHGTNNDYGRYDHKGDNQTKLREALLWRLGKK